MRKRSSKGDKWADFYSRKARADRFPARSVYKLQEIQRRHNIIRKGDAVLDLGCRPGSWLKYASTLVGPGGRVTGVDIEPVSRKPPSNAEIHVLDIFAMDDEQWTEIGSNFNVVLSDMAPSTTGNRSVDAARSFNLCQAALDVAGRVLSPGGAFVCKIFQGEDFQAFHDSVKAAFRACRIFKPKSSRKASREIFIIGLGKTGGKHVGS